MAKEAKKENEFTKEKLRQKHEAHLIRIAALAERDKTKRKETKQAANTAQENFNKNRTRKNYRKYITALRRAFNS